MSNATWTAVVFASLVAACASAGSPSQPADAQPVTPHHDDASNITSDAPIVKMDGAVITPDAFVPQDAPAPPIDSAIFCTANSQCTNAGECCITLGGSSGICGPGFPVGTDCIPNPS
jgi:hypothetical protein